MKTNFLSTGGFSRLLMIKIPNRGRLKPPVLSGCSVTRPSGCEFQNQDFLSIGGFSRLLMIKMPNRGRLKPPVQTAVILKIMTILLILIQTPLHAQNWQVTYRQADSLMQKRAFKESIPLYEQALPLAEKEYGKNTEQYLQTRNGLGRAITFVKKKEEIEPFLLENLELGKKYGEKTAIYAQALHNAGTFYSPLEIGNNSTKSEEYLKQALALRKEILGEKHKDYSNTLNNLAGLYANMGNYSAAEPLYKESLQIRKETLGEKHPEYAQSLNNLAILYHNMGNYAATELLYKESLQIRKESVGTKHPDYGDGLNNLGVLYWNMGNYAAAEPFCKESLQIRKETVGEKHPNYAWSLNNLANLYQSMGNYAAAEPLYKQALQTRKEVLGDKHPDYADNLVGLSSLYQAKSYYLLADSLIKQAIEIYSNTVHPNLWYGYNNLGNIQLIKKNYLQAEENLQKGSEVLEKIQSKGSLNYTSNQHDLLRLYWQSKNYEKAAPLALEIKKNAIDLTLKNFPTLSEKEREAFFDNKMRRYVQDFSSFVALTATPPQPTPKGMESGIPALLGRGQGVGFFLPKCTISNFSAKPFCSMPLPSGNTIFWLLRINA